MKKTIITTVDAPEAIGTYSQAVRVGNTVYLSGQIPLVPNTMTMIGGDFRLHVEQMFNNLQAVVNAAGGDFSHVVKLTIYLLDMNNFPIVNEVMANFCEQPYPARAVVAVSALPRDALVEVDAVMVLP